MSLRKRGGIWWIDVYAPSGERVRRTTETANKALAQELHDRLKAELWRIGHLGQKPRHTWNEAVVRWLKEQSHRLPPARTSPSCDGSISISAASRWIRSRAPWPIARVRFLTREEAQRLLDALPPHLSDMTAFTLATGLRAANVTGLQWTQVDLVRRLAWIHADQAKAQKALPVPLNSEAVVLIRKWLGRHPTHVFSFRGKPIAQVSTKAWYAALKQAGIEDFRWHDLRHTWASWHVQNGTPLYALQEMGGWASTEMVRRYAHLAADRLAPFAERLCALRAVTLEGIGTHKSQRAN